MSKLSLLNCIVEWDFSSLMGVYMASKTLNMNDLFLFSFNLLIFIGEEDLRSAMTWILQNVPISEIVSLTVTLRTSYYGTLILLRYHKISLRLFFTWRSFSWPIQGSKSHFESNHSLDSFPVERILKINLKSYFRFSIKS